MNSDTILKYHRLIADGKVADAALLMAVEFESGEWLSGELQKDDYYAKREFERKKKEGIGISLSYYEQAYNSSSGESKLRALVGLFRCKHGSDPYDYPEIKPSLQLRRERGLCGKLMVRWSSDYRCRIQRVKDHFGGAVLCVEALAADLGLEGSIPPEQVESTYELAVKNGSVAACFRLGNLKLRLGQDADAERCFRLGVTRRSVESQRALGALLLRSGKVCEGVDCLIRAAFHGSGEAWYSLAEYLATAADSGNESVDVASCYRFAVRCGCAAAYDWLGEHDPVDSKDRYGFRADRQRIIAEYNRRKSEIQIECCDGDSCYAAYKHLLGLGNYNHPKDLRKALERAATLGCREAIYDLARLLDSCAKQKDGRNGRSLRDVESCREKDDLAAVSLYRRAAESGHVGAMRVVGCLYRDGRVVVANKNMAYEWMLKAAVAGDPEAQLAVADMFRLGAGCDENLTEASLWYSNAYDNECLTECDAELVAYGCWQFGQLLEVLSDKHPDWQRILPVYKRAAEAFRSADAFWRLGELYESGESGASSAELASQYYCNALFIWGERRYYGNEPKSMFDDLSQNNSHYKDENAISEQSAYFTVLAYGYDVGFHADDKEKALIINPDASKARKWYSLAAEHGSATAAWRYGELCELGVGGPVDLNSAEVSYCAAASTGRLEMAKSLAAKYKAGVIGGVRSQERAATWYQKCIELGDASSAFLLGKLYLIGAGVPQDESKAIELFEQSQCDEGYMAIAKICLKRNSAGRDLDQALKCLSLCSSCEARILQGKLCYEQGRRFEDGQGVPRDLLEAVRWYSKAALAKCVEAQVRLSELFEGGADVLARNLYLASRWSYWAAENGDAQSAFRLGVYCELGVVKDGHGMSYVKHLYEKACRGGCKDAGIRLEELALNPEWGAEMVASSVSVFDVKTIDTVEDLVSAEKKMSGEIARCGLASAEAASWLTKVKRSKVLAGYVADRDISELDIPRDKFSIEFNETRVKVEPYYEEYDGYDEGDFDDCTPRTVEDAYEIYGSKLWDA